MRNRYPRPQNRHKNIFSRPIRRLREIRRAKSIQSVRWRDGRAVIANISFNSRGRRESAGESLPIFFVIGRRSWKNPSVHHGTVRRSSKTFVAAHLARGDLHFVAICVALLLWKNDRIARSNAWPILFGCVSRPTRRPAHRA